MDAAADPQAEAMPEINDDTIRSRIKFFLERMTAVKWRTVMFDSPDEATTFLTAELLTDIGELLSDTIRSALCTAVLISKEKVQASLGDVLPQGFASALDVEEDFNSASAEKLTDLMSTMVTEAVNSTLSSEKRAEEADRMIPSTSRLSAMLEHTFAMLKHMAAKVQKICEKGACRRKLSPPPPSPPLPPPPEDTKPSLDTRDGFADATAKMAQKLLAEKLANFVTDLVVDGAAVDEAQTAKEIEEVAREVADDLFRHKDVARGVSRIKGFMEKCHARAAIKRTVTWLLRNHMMVSRPSSRRLMKSLMDGVDSVIDNQGSESTGEVLADLVHNYINDVTKPEVVQEGDAGSSCQVTVLPPRTELHREIWRNVTVFLAVMKWWQESLADSEAARMVQEVREEISGQSGQAVGRTAFLAPSDSMIDIRRRAVEVFVQKLVCQTFKKAKINPPKNDLQAIIDRLREAIWAEVKEVEFQITAENFKDIDKAVYKDLCDTCGCAEVVLVVMNSENLSFEKFIASSLKKHLMAPPKRCNAICRFLCSLSKGISKTFRCVS